AGAAPDSAAASRLDLAEAVLASVLAPLAGAEFRVEALSAALAEAPDGAALAPQLAAINARLALLLNQ
nr:hypothetical protein [Sandarakinorhabdus sp.]